MKTNKRIIGMLVGVLIITSLSTGCSSNKTNGNSQQNSVQQENNIKSLNEVVYDENDIKITCVEVQDNISTKNGVNVIFKIENNSDKNIRINAERTSINDIMIDNFMQEIVTPGKKANGVWEIWQDNIDSNSVTSLENIGMNMIIVNDDTSMMMYEKQFELDVTK